MINGEEGGDTPYSQSFLAYLAPQNELKFETFNSCTLLYSFPRLFVLPRIDFLPLSLFDARSQMCVRRRE